MSGGLISERHRKTAMGSTLSENYVNFGPQTANDKAFISTYLLYILHSTSAT